MIKDKDYVEDKYIGIYGISIKDISSITIMELEKLGYEIK